MYKLILLFSLGLLTACGGASGTQTTTNKPTTKPPVEAGGGSGDSAGLGNGAGSGDGTTNTGNQSTKIDKKLTNIINQQQLNARLPSAVNTPAPQGALFNLGMELFFSKSLSGRMDVACVSCHHPFLGGGDALSQPVGVDAVDPDLLGPGRTHNGNRLVDLLADGSPNVPRNSPTTFNIQLYNRVMFWDGRIEVTEKAVSQHGTGQKIRTPDSLFRLPDSKAGKNLSEAQARFPITSITEMLGHTPARLLINEHRRHLMVRRLRGTGLQAGDLKKNNWLKLFQQAFSDTSDNPDKVITMARISEALSVYQRSQLMINNRWFAYVRGKHDAITDEEKAGALLFFSTAEQGGYACARCHEGNHFTDEKFYNLAIPQFGRGKNIFQSDSGRFLASKDVTDSYKFRTPSLLNSEVTGPWSHSGAYNTLDGIVRHHLNIADAVKNYDYSLAPLSQFRYIPDNRDKYRRLTEQALKKLQKSSEWPLTNPKTANEQHITQLVAFLKTLTDPCTQSRNCLKKWIPSAGTDSPDNKRLVARFASFDEQLNTYSGPGSDGGNTGNTGKNTYFSDVTAASGLDYSIAFNDGVLDEQHTMTGGVTVADYDNDGWIDFFISHARAPGKLFRNNQKGKFAAVTSGDLAGLNSQQLGAIFFDPDEDGDQDLLLTEDTASNGFSRLLMNNKGVFKESANSFGLDFSRFTFSLSLSDFDNDGDLDLYSAHWGDKKNPKAPGFFWRKQADGSYLDVSNIAPALLVSPLKNIDNVDVVFTANFVDIDGDHDNDVLLSGDFKTSQILRNTGTRFTDITTSQISDENGMGGAVGDYDNDGDLDWFVTSIHNPKTTKSYIGGESGNRLYQNDGSGQFYDQTSFAGVRDGYWAWGACFADFNNDGWLDIFHTNGMFNGQSKEESIFGAFYNDPSRLFINNKNGRFIEKSAEYGIGHTGHGRGISCFDYDNDGDIDILIANNGDHPSLYRNNSFDKNNFITVQLAGTAENTQAVGAKVWLTIGNQTQYRQLQLGSNYLSNNPVEAHFGLDKATKIDSLRIRWPDGTSRDFNNVAVNQRVRINKQGNIQQLPSKN